MSLRMETASFGLLGRERKDQNTFLPESLVGVTHLSCVRSPVERRQTGGGGDG